MFLIYLDVSSFCCTNYIETRITVTSGDCEYTDLANMDQGTLRASLTLERCCSRAWAWTVIIQMQVHTSFVIFCYEFTPYFNLFGYWFFSCPCFIFSFSFSIYIFYYMVIFYFYFFFFSISSSIYFVFVLSLYFFSWMFRYPFHSLSVFYSMKFSEVKYLPCHLYMV